MDSLISQKTGKPLVNNVRRQVIDKYYNWGLYVYRRATGGWFMDGEGGVLNIPSDRGDLSKMAELKKIAIHYGDDGLGTAVFVPGLTRISDEEHSVQKDRMMQGLIPSMNDLGAWKAAKDTQDLHGSEE